MMIDETTSQAPADDPDPWELENTHWVTKWPWQTPGLPDLVGVQEAAKILGVNPMTLYRWLKPGSGVNTQWGGFGPNKTRMIPPKPVAGSSKKGGVWVREDVLTFARDIGAERDRPSRDPAPVLKQPPVAPIDEAEENVLRAVCSFTEPVSAVQVAERAGRSPRTVGLHLSQLEHQGLLVLGGLEGGRRSFVGSPEGRALLLRLDEPRGATA
jgi:hypothetical protein